MTITYIQGILIERFIIIIIELSTSISSRDGKLALLEKDPAWRMLKKSDN